MNVTLKGGFMVDTREKSKSDGDLSQSLSWGGDESAKNKRSGKDAKQVGSVKYLILQLMCDTG